MGVLNVNTTAVLNLLCQTPSASKPDLRKYIFTAALEAKKWLTRLSSTEVSSAYLKKNRHELCAPVK